MNQRLVIRDGHSLKAIDIDEWTIYVAVASLAAEPRTLPELLEAMRRYQPDHSLADGLSDISGLDEVPDQRGDWCLIDLPSETVVGGNNFPLPEANAGYVPEENEIIEGFPMIWTDLSPVWEFVTDDKPWQDRIIRRASRVAERPQIDARGVLYGLPMVAYLAQRVLAAAGKGLPERGEMRRKQTIKIHAAWLTLPQADLNGQTPRQLLLRDRDRLQRDLEHRSQQWSRQGSPALPLSKECHAYRFGGFCTTEICLYFELVRGLLDTAWNTVEEQPQISLPQLVDLLRKRQDELLQGPPNDGGGLTMANLIESERRRKPISSSADHFDCDCPICQAEADGAFGIGFLWYDGHHLDMEGDFAFSLEDDESEWNEHYAYDIRGSRDTDTDKADLDDTDTDDREADDEVQSESVWKSSYVNWDLIEESPELATLSISFLLAEIVTELKQRDGSKQLIQELNQAFADFRRSDDITAVHSNAVGLCDQLESIAATHPELTARCADLQSHLDEVVRVRQ